jgi:formate hydrogenlyase subunit 3/multisubunit Na+/H+ antiporter MnhD subunit
VLTAALLVLLAIYAAVRVTRRVFAELGLDVRETLLWFGLAELPPPPTSRRISSRVS